MHSKSAHSKNRSSKYNSKCWETRVKMQTNYRFWPLKRVYNNILNWQQIKNKHLCVSIFFSLKIYDMRSHFEKKLEMVGLYLHYMQIQNNIFTFKLWWFANKLWYMQMEKYNYNFDFTIWHFKCLWINYKCAFSWCYAKYY